MSHTPPPTPPPLGGPELSGATIQLAYQQLYEANRAALLSSDLTGKLAAQGISVDTEPDAVPSEVAEAVRGIYSGIEVRISAATGSVTLVALNQLLTRVAAANQFATYLIENGHPVLGKYLTALVGLPALDNESE